MKKKLFLALALIAMQGHAQVPSIIVTPTFVSSCGQYMASRRGNDAQSLNTSAMAVIWLWGFLSRYNTESYKESINIPEEIETMHLLLEKYCRQNPVGGLGGASSFIIRELGGDPAKSLSK